MNKDKRNYIEKISMSCSTTIAVKQKVKKTDILNDGNISNFKPVNIDGFNQ